MNLKSRLFALTAAAVMLTACTDIKTAIVGRWESPTWTMNDRPIYAQFDADGTVQYRAPGGVFHSQWMFLNSGELQVTMASGQSYRCKVSLSGEGKTLTVEPPSCLAWDQVPGSIELTKQ